MNAASTGCAEGENTPDPSPRFEVSLLYQDLPTGVHARQFLNRVLDHCQLATEFSLNLWKLELFHLPEICEEAVLSACDAALVLLSVRGDIGLEPSTENWLLQWLDRRVKDEGALAVLIDCDMQRLDSVALTLFRLQEITRGSQIRLFAGFLPSVPEIQPPTPFQQELQDSNPMLFTAYHASVPSDVPPESGLGE